MRGIAFDLFVGINVGNTFVMMCVARGCEYRDENILSNRNYLLSILSL